jgi:hypothetical protein
MDYLKVVVHEVRQLRNMLAIFGIDLHGEINLDYAKENLNLSAISNAN